MKKYSSLFGVVTALFLALPGYASTAYTYSSFDEPLTSASSPETYPMGINASGQIVGSFKSIYNSASIGFFKSGSSYSLVSVPNAIETNANGINDAGYIVGNYISSANALEYGFVEYGGNYTSIKYPGTTYGQRLFGINNSQLAVGEYLDGTGNEHGFIVNGSTGAISSFDYPGTPSNTVAYGINNIGQIVGTYGGPVLGNTNIPTHGFLKDGNTYTSINYPGAANTFIFGVNTSGEITGYYNDATGYHSFVKDDNIYTSIIFPGATATFAQGINDAGQIVGYYEDYKFSYHGFLATPVATVPVPSSMWFLASGLLLLIPFLIRNRRFTFDDCHCQQSVERLATEHFA